MRFLTAYRLPVLFFLIFSLPGLAGFIKGKVTEGQVYAFYKRHYGFSLTAQSLLVQVINETGKLLMLMKKARNGCLRAFLYQKQVLLGNV